MDLVKIVDLFSNFFFEFFSGNILIGVVLGWIEFDKNF